MAQNHRSAWLAVAIQEAKMLIGCIADDLTGATHDALTFCREGLAAFRVNGMPDKALHAAEADAIEELEATARLYLILRHERVRTPDEGTGGRTAALPSELKGDSRPWIM